jgi:hypothetical protein
VKCGGGGGKQQILEFTYLKWCAAFFTAVLICQCVNECVMMCDVLMCWFDPISLSTHHHGTQNGPHCNTTAE